MNSQEQTGPTIGSWQILQKIGDGSFGNVYSAVPKSIESTADTLTEQVAIKTEAITNVKQMLLLEYKIYKEFQGSFGFPRVIEYMEHEVFSFLVMEKLEMTLDKCAANYFQNNFVPKDVLLLIMRETLKIIKGLHDQGYLYRDVKPANFMLKRPYDQIFIIDFGLCKKYLVNDRHIALKEGKKLVGTPIFCSLNTHLGLQQSRRDDLESWVMMSLYLSINLPWQSVISRKDLSKEQQYEEIFKIKQKINWQEIIRENQKCRSLTKIPVCLTKILAYVRQMRFDEAPNYQFLNQLIGEQYRKTTNTHMSDQSFSWESKIWNKNQMQKSPSPVKKIGKINFKLPVKQVKKDKTQSETQNQKQNRTNTE